MKPSICIGRALVIIISHGIPGAIFLPKKAFFSDTVLVEMAQKLRVARVKFGVFPGAKIGGKKTKISRKLESEDFLKKF